MAITTGDVGEDYVRLWASQADIVANPARRDRRGWDYFFEFNQEHAELPSVPLDRLPPPMHCIVQVKSTRTDADGDDVTLSTWPSWPRDAPDCRLCRMP